MIAPSWLANFPALSPHMTALLVEGDVEGHYNARGHHNSKQAVSDHGHAATAALAASAARHNWTFPAFRAALLDTNASGGSHAREFEHRRGHDAALGYLQRVWERAEKLVDRTPRITSRQDAHFDLYGLRERIARCDWRGRGTATALRLLMAHWHTASRFGGRRYTLSYREMAEAAGCTLTTAFKAMRRYLQPWLRLISPGSGEEGSTWELLDGGTLRADTDDLMDVSVIERLMGLDAFAHRALGASSLKILAALAARDGMTAAEVAAAAQVSPATAYRHLRRLAEYELIMKDTEVWVLAGAAQEALLETWAGWDAVAAQEGTSGTASRRRRFHAEQRTAWQTVVLPRLRSRRMPDVTPVRGDEIPPDWVTEAGCLVDPDTGEILHEFTVGSDGRLLVLHDEIDYDELVRLSKEAQCAYLAA